jgi:phosphoribosylformylglycinamidine cyclo-ligase
MGIGFVVLVTPSQVQQTISFFESHNIAVYNIGEIISGNGELIGLPD